MIAANLITLVVAAAGAAAAPLYKRESGTATYYAAGLGACGWTNSGSDFIVALNAPQWGGSSGQASSRCGKSVVITNNKNGKTQTAQVADLCPGCGYGSLDMSEGLFSALNNGNMGDGVFPISWHWAGQASPKQESTPTTKAAPKATYTKQVQSSYTPAPSANRKAAVTHVASSSTSYAPQPSSTASPNTVETTPEWWDEIDNKCGFTPDTKTVTVTIGPSAILAKEDLAQACGKWIQIENNENGKALSVQVTSYLPDVESGFIALADGYKLLSILDGDYPRTIKSATWGFIDGQGL